MSFFPLIGKKFSEDFSVGIIALKKTLPILSIFLFLAGSVVFLGAHLIITLFYGENFLPSVIDLQILAFVPLFIALNNFLGMFVMLNLRMDKAYFKITLIGVIIGLLLSWMLSKSFGHVGASWGWLINQASIASISYFYLRNKQINIIEFQFFEIKTLYANIRKIVKVG
jgi:O-antigen/teichoic acid export membrane protein